jgi:hypothetical protein
VFKFTAKIYRFAINYQVDIPPRISVKLGERKHIPVKGFINSTEFRGTLIPRKENRHILYLNTELRKKARVGEHDNVSVEIEFDPESREIPIPEDVEMIFLEHPLVYNTFLKLTPAAKREILQYTLAGKREETRLKRIELMARRMLERAAKKNS